MILKKIKIKNFRGIKDEVILNVNPFNCIVGKNDVGKSTILKALDAFLNDKISVNDANLYCEYKTVYISIDFFLYQIINI